MRSGGSAPDLDRLAEDYELLHELGAGGMAAVYLARERITERLVAIKVLRGRYERDEEALSRFAREARMLATLDHPNIVRTYAVRRLGDPTLAIVMRYVPGETLRHVLRAEGSLAVETAERVLRDVAEALGYAHEHGIVHRDVKPENIFMEEGTGRALLSDFGLARPVEGDTELTMVGTAIGTPTYMSPEQIDGTPIDRRSDIYSLGLVGWEMLAGRRPWEGSNLYSVIYKQKHEELPSLGELRPDAPQRLRLAIEGSLRKDPDARWPSVRELLARLRSHDLPETGVVAPAAPSLALETTREQRDAPTLRFRRPEPLAPDADQAELPQAELPQAELPQAEYPEAEYPEAEPGTTEASVPEPLVGERSGERPPADDSPVGPTETYWGVIAPDASRSAADGEKAVPVPVGDVPGGDEPVVYESVWITGPDTSEEGAGPEHDVDALAAELYPRRTTARLALAIGLPVALAMALALALTQGKPAAIGEPLAEDSLATTSRAGTIDTGGTGLETTRPELDAAAVPRPVAEARAGGSAGTRADSLGRCASPAATDQRACLFAHIAENDEELNRTYRELVDEMRRQAGAARGAPDPAVVRRLRGEQRSWLDRRDAECRQRGRGQEGPLWAPVRARCFAEFSDQRAAELARRLAALR